MNLFINKKVRKLLDKGSLMFSYICLGLCALLVACNIALFITIPHEFKSAGVVLSNIITVFITVLALRPISKVVQKLVIQKQKELADKDSLQKKVSELEAAKKDLEDQLDMRYQAESLPSNINFTFKLEQAEYAKIGYVVKEDSFENLSKNEKINEDIPERNILTKTLKFFKVNHGEDPRKILYIHREYYKASIGIDFENIRFAIQKDKIIFYGVGFSKLHNITSELIKSEDDVDLCLVYKESDGKLKLYDDSDYDDIRKSYSKLQQIEAHKALEEEVGIVCKQYTSVFRECLSERFPCICFTDAIDYFNEELEWNSLNNGSMTRKVAEIASSMLLLASVINKTQSIETAAPSLN